MPWSYIASIRDSLDVFYNRNQIMYDFLDQENDYLWLRVSVAAKRRRLGFCLGYSWLTPKLPREFLQRKLDSGRRHTIGEPERYAKLIEVMFDTRRAFVNLRKLAREDCSMIYRQRSYDPNEVMDEELGLSQLLGFEYEPRLKDCTTGDLHVDLLMMEKAIVSSAWFKAKREKEQRLLLQQQKVLDRRRRAPPPPPPEDEDDVVDLWHENFADDGRLYYYNPTTGESSWDTPPADKSQVLRPTEDPLSHAWYWLNLTTGESTWMT